MVRTRYQEPEESPTNEYPDIKTEYVYSPEMPSLEHLSIKWKKHKACSKSAVLHRAAKENWTELRRKFHEGAQQKAFDLAQQKLAQEMSESVIDANRRHVQLGRALQTIGASAFKKGPAGHLVVVDNADEKQPPIPFKSAKDAAQFVRDGTELERKALGLADQIVKVQMARDLARKTVEVVGKYVTDPDVLENIGRDMEIIVGAEEEILDEVSQGSFNPVKHGIGGPGGDRSKKV